MKRPHRHFWLYVFLVAVVAVTTVAPALAFRAMHWDLSSAIGD